MLTTQHIDPTAANQKPPFILIRMLRRVREWIAPPTLAHEDRQSTAVRKARAAIVIVGCLTMIGLAIWFAKPIQDGYQDYSATKLVKEARAILGENAQNSDILSAVLKATEAVSEAPEHIEAVRLNAELLTAMSRNEAIYFWDKLDKLGQMTLADKRGKVRALLRLGRAKEASQLLEQLLEDFPADAQIVALSEEVWGKSQSNDAVRSALKSYTDAHNDDAESKLKLYTLQLRSNIPSEHNEAVLGLWEISGKPTDLGLTSLLLLSEFVTDSPTSMSIVEKQRLAKTLETHPKANAESHLRAMDLRVLLDPQNRQRLIDAEILRCNELDREDLLPLARWLVVQHEFARVVAFLKPKLKSIKAYQPLVLNYLTALSALGLWSDVETLVNDKDVILSIGQRSFYQAHLMAIKGGDPEEVKRLLKKVMDGAQGDSELLMNLGNYCEEPKRGVLDIAEEAYKACTNIPRKDRQAFPGWIRVARNRGNTAGLLTAATEANRRFPDDQNYIESVLYVKLLLGIEIENSLARAVRLLSANSADSTRKLIAALGFWRLGDLTSAISTCQHINLNETTPGQQAIFASIASDAGFKSELQTVLSGIRPQSLMLPEEQTIHSRLLKADVGEAPPTVQP